MKQFDSLRDAIVHVVEDIIDNHEDRLFYSVRWIDNEWIRLEFARYDIARKQYIPVTLVNERENNRHMERVWHRKVRLPKLMQEAEDLTFEAYKSHMEWKKRREEQGYE
jgi:hypothetical protein